MSAEFLHADVAQGSRLEVNVLPLSGATLIQDIASQTKRYGSVVHAR